MNDSITIGFSRPSKLWPIPPFFAWAIMAFESIVQLKWINFSHAYVRFNLDAFDRGVIFQASGMKDNFVGQTMFRGMEVIVKEFTIPLSPDTKKAVVQYMIDEAGTPYALLSAFGIVAVKAASLFGCRIKNPVTQKGDWCSEVAAIILKDYDNLPLSSDDVRRMLPSDLCDYLEARLRS